MMLNELSALEQAAAIRHQEASSEEVVLACLQRIQERDDELRAWAFVDTDLALAQARAKDASDPSGPLHGVPVGVKDIFDTKDMPTEYGTQIYAEHRPLADATAVADLRVAGAVILGKTVTSELATWHPAETTNPHDRCRTPGGSSSGSAAAVADSMVSLALGTQTVGSTIRPAAFCGVLGFKPTHAWIDLSGVKRLSARLDTIGFFARHVDDLQAATQAMASGMPRAISFHMAPSLALVRTPWWEHADTDGQHAVEEAAALLGSAGAQVEEELLPDDFDLLPEAQDTITAVDVARSLAFEYERAADVLSDELREFINRGRAITQQYTDAVKLVERCSNQLDAVLSTYDALLVPAVLGEAPLGLESTGDPLFCRAWTCLGAPAISVPGLIGASGMPIGVQLVGPRGGDGALLSTARWVAECLA
jgi:amidase